VSCHINEPIKLNSMRKSIIISIIILFVYQISFSQIQVSGKVFDDSDQTLPGVSVLVKGTTIGTMTLADGSFSISVPDSSSILVFSYIGMNTIEKNVNINNDMKVSIEPSDTEISEVVVTALGISRSVKSFGYSTPNVFSGRNKRNKSKQTYINIDGGMNTEEYDFISENSFKNSFEEPVSTLSIDVDNASYSNVRRFLNSGQLPPKDAVRIEEMINYFTYDYPSPESEHPFSFTTEYAQCPWNDNNKLLHIGIQGKKLDYNDLKPSNFVFLLDVSGSMSSYNKLPLLKKSFLKLVENLGRKDKVSIVVYAGAAGLVLPPTAASEKSKIKDAIQNLSAGGSTAGGAGIKLAYKTAKEAFIEDGNNRVILATDGDFNLGISSTSDLIRLINEKRKGGIYLTILGFGMGNYKDGRMEQISNAGNGNYFYIDNISEADKVFGKDMRANMFTIAKDVKIQIEFNPLNVKEYRLIGYENRLLDKEDFKDDSKDAGELGPGHTVTALYEIIPVYSNKEYENYTDLRYQKSHVISDDSLKNELMTLKFRYKAPKEDESKLIEHIVKNKEVRLFDASENFKFSAAVASFGMLLRESDYINDFNFKDIRKLAYSSLDEDINEYRTEFIKLIKKAEKIKEELADK
jgi:Ca-activated chloride channel family protein